MWPLLNECNLLRLHLVITRRQVWGVIQFTASRFEAEDSDSFRNVIQLTQIHTNVRSSIIILDQNDWRHLIGRCFYLFVHLGQFPPSLTVGIFDMIIWLVCVFDRGSSGLPPWKIFGYSGENFIFFSNRLCAFVVSIRYCQLVLVQLFVLVTTPTLPSRD